VKQDSGDSKKGDIVIHIPTKTAERLHEYLAVSGLEQAQVVWKSSRGKRHNTSSLLRRPPPDLTDECSEAIEQLSRVTLDAATDGALQQLIPVNADNPINPENNPDGARVPDVVVAGNLIFTRLYRQRFGRGVPNRNALRQFMAAAGTVITTVMSFALDLTEEVVGEEIIRMENERLKKAESENLQCKGEFVCLEDECQGYSKTGQSIPLIGRKFPYREHERLQLGYCRAVSIVKFGRMSVQTLTAWPRGHHTVVHAKCCLSLTYIV
jgi:hypothetical protein